jgi:hypothetical protein
MQVLYLLDAVMVFAIMTQGSDGTLREKVGVVKAFVPI